MRETLRVIQRCTSTHRDGAPSMAQSRASGYRTGHDPGAQEARCKGGHANSRSAWAGKLLPARLQPMIFLPEDSLGEVQCGNLPPGRVVIASLASSLERTIAAGALEERLRGFDDLGARAPGGKASP